MDAIEIEGGVPLKGEVEVSGSKNATLPQIAAALLAPGRSVFRGVPDLADIRTLGRLLGNMGARVERDGSTLQVDVQRVASVPMAQATQSFANRPLGQLSPRDTVRATIGGSAVWIDYSRPARRGRDIFGVLEPWNKVWRTGANAATQLNTPVDLVIGGATVPAGTYTLWTLPSPTGWKLIINKQNGQWGTEYHPEQDLVRVDAKTETLATPVERFVIAFEPAAAPSAITFAWDKARYSVSVAKK